MKYTIGMSLVLITAAVALAASGAPPSLELPKDYRSWAHTKSMVIGDPKNGLYGFHHVYVPPAALATYKTGGKHAEGTQLAVAFYHVVDDGKGTITQGPLKMVAVMKKDRTASDTGGWRYGAFGADGKALAIDVATGCYGCHTAKKDRDFVFSEYQ